MKLKIENFFLFTLFFLVPIDWFSITGTLLREAGAKPFIPFSVLLFFYLLASNPIKTAKEFLTVDEFIFIYLLLLFGFFSYISTLAISNYHNNFSRSHILQYISQSMMISIFIIVTKTIKIFLEKNNFSIIGLIYKTAILHLLLFAFELFINEKSDYLIFNLFRTPEALFIDRPSGLMSEPSYFGVFAGISASLLLLFTKRKILPKVLALILIVLALYIKAKTIFPVLACIAFYLICISRIDIKTRILIISTSLLISLPGYYVIQQTSAFDFSENLSSAMRIGSALVGINIASDGFGFFGIGPGQFHFFYNEKYFPDFLFNSQEALNQLQSDASSRASTFNLPIRILVEFGLIGVLLVLFFLKDILLKNISSNSVDTKIGFVIIFGSFGFLLTQDTYCYPYLALGIALLTKKKDFENEHTNLG